MAQLFKPAANSVARASLLGVATLPWVIFWAGSTITRSPANTKVDVPLNQPVPFSHRHHVLELGIDCSYCHVSVEKTNYASIPASEVCMSCHSQIWTNSPLLQPIRDSYETNTPITWANGDRGWNQVVKAPEFVYFDHSIHIARGLVCNQCHGPVQEMALTWKGHALSMAWCLECHREPEKYIYKDPDPKNANKKPGQKFRDFYAKVQNHEPLSAAEESIRKGDTLPAGNDPEEGKKLVEAYKIKKDQLADCWVCHR